MTVTKQLAKQISADATIALQTVAKKYKLELHARGGAIDSETFIAKFEFKVPLIVTNDPTMTNEMLQMGLGKRGTIIIFKNSRKEAVIEESRRTKYLVSMNGKQYTIPFKSCELK